MEVLEMQAFNFDDVHAMNDLEVQNFTDARGYKLLMLASEAGHIGAVNNLIERGEDVNFEVETENAASLAFARGHHQVVLTLLKANSKIPHNFNHETASINLNNFVVLSEFMHRKVREVNEADQINFTGTKDFLRQKIERNPSVMHFYDKNNISLLKRAAISSMFGIYELLLTLNIFFAPHENLNLIFGQLSDDDRRKFREITFEVCPNLLIEEIMILMRNCKLGPDSPKDRHSEFMKIIRDAFEILFKFPSIAAVLKVVTASFNFKIVFDFSRTSIQFLDPSAEPYNNGMFYFNGRIFIGAKDMLDPSAFSKVVGVIAHELCHYAMFLVYGNLAKPYKKKNVRVAERFEIISQECEKVKDCDELIKVVYDDYDEGMWHTELIVRVCHIRAFYFNAIEILNEKLRVFVDLFNFFDNVCVREMEAAIPSIQRKFNPFKKAQRRVQRRWIITLVISFLLGASFSVWGLIHAQNPTLTWSELSFEDQNSFKNTSVNFHGVDVKFGDLFANDSSVYDLLSSEQIKSGLRNETKELSNAIALTFDNFVFIKFSNMTKELKEKFVEFKANFQGQNVPLKSLVKNQSNLDLLNSSQVKEIFKGSNLIVSKETEMNTKFVIERFFIDENIWVSEYNGHFEKGRVKLSHGDIKSFTQIVENLKKEKVFLLSSVAGEGKSTIFRHFSLKLKEEFPTKWIQFVDLKKHSKAYERNKFLKFSFEGNLLNFLSLDLLKLEGFELKVFNEHFQSGNVIFLFDGIDEVSPIYKDFMIDLTTSIASETENLQFISTRPQHSAEFQANLNVKALKLVPLGNVEAFELCIKFIAYNNEFNADQNELLKVLNENFFSDGEIMNFEEFKKVTQNVKFSREISFKVYSTIEKSLNILKSIKVEGEDANQDPKIMNNPLLIRLIAEMSSEDFEVNANDNLNFYELYKIFIQKKFKIVQEEKGEIVNKDVIKVQTDSRVNVMQVHQVYAIKLIFSGRISIENLQISKSINKVSREEISRFGILQVYSQDDFDFVHRTFSEFFLTQYVIDTFSYLNNDESSDDIGNIEIIFNLVFEKEFRDSKNFLIHFLKSETESSPFFQLLRKIFLEKANGTEDSHVAFEIMKFFVKNCKKYFSFFIDNFYLDFESFQKMWKHSAKSKSDKDTLFLIMKLTDSEYRTFVHKYFFETDYAGYQNIEDVNPFLSLLNETLDSSQISSLFLMEDKKNLNIIAFALEVIDLENFQILWEFIEEKLSKSSQKKLLMMEKNSCGNALHFSAFNEKDKKVFTFVLNILIDKNVTDEEIQKLVMKRHWSCPTTLHGLIKNSDLSTIQELMKYFEIALQNDKEDLKKFLSHRNKNGETIFNSDYQNNYDDKLKPFRDILQKTFDDSEQFKETLKILEISSNVFRFFEQPFLPEDLSELRRLYWNFDDFDFVVNNWEKICERLGTERFKTLLLSKNEGNESLLFDIGRLNGKENLLQEFLIKTKNFLNEEEFYKLLEEDKFNNTPLMCAAVHKNEESLKIFWEFLDKNLKENEMKVQLLAVKDQHLDTALQFSAWNKDANSFLFVKDIYEKFFTQDEIKEIFMQLNHNNFPFIVDTISNLTENGCQVVANYLKELFIDEKLNLQNILSHRKNFGETICSFFKNKEHFKEQIKVFEELLRFSFEGSKEDFDTYLESLEQGG